MSQNSCKHSGDGDGCLTFIIIGVFLFIFCIATHYRITRLEQMHGPKTSANPFGSYEDYTKEHPTTHPDILDIRP